MPTVDYETARILKDNNGVYPVPPDEPPDPICVKIVEYTNPWGKQAYGLIFEGEKDGYTINYNYCLNPKVFFERVI